MYSINLKHVAAVFSITHEEFGGRPSVLIKDQDFQVVCDSTNLFLRLTKDLTLQKSQKIELEVLNGNSTSSITKLKARCKPKGSIFVSFEIIIRFNYISSFIPYM